LIPVADIDIVLAHEVELAVTTDPEQRRRLFRECVMDLARRQFLQAAAAVAVVSGLPRPAAALDYPTRPVRLIVGFSPGGPADILARLIAQWLTEDLGQPFVVENRPGAGTNIGTEAVARAVPDGYTLLLITAANAINATLYEKLSFNFSRDIAPVARLGREPNVLVVHPSVPARSVPEFIVYAKANPGKVTMASGGVGAPSHLSGELFKLMTGISLVHVPYRGAAPALTDLVGGQVQLYFAPMLSTIEYVRAGKLRALAVTTAERSAAFPDVPAVAEFVPGFDAGQWYGIGAPAGTPPEIVDRLNRSINAGVADPKMGAKFIAVGTTALAGSPAEFGQFIADEIEKWGKVVKFSGAKAD
jgi:tripartite-type tricarboxylate transporter receptor subunit TctC